MPFLATNVYFKCTVSFGFTVCANTDMRYAPHFQVTSAFYHSNSNTAIRKRRGGRSSSSSSERSSKYTTTNTTTIYTPSSSSSIVEREEEEEGGSFFLFLIGRQRYIKSPCWREAPRGRAGDCWGRRRREERLNSRKRIPKPMRQGFMMASG